MDLKQFCSWILAGEAMALFFSSLNQVNWSTALLGKVFSGMLIHSTTKILSTGLTKVCTFLNQNSNKMCKFFQSALQSTFGDQDNESFKNLVISTSA